MRGWGFVSFLLVCSLTRADVVADISHKIEYPISLKNLGFEMPRVADATMSEILGAKTTVYYKLPRMNQQYHPPTTIEHRDTATGRVSRTQRKAIWALHYSTFEPDFNGNFAFPWEGTFGLHHVIEERLLEKTYGSVNFLALPAKNGSILHRVLVLNELPIKWIFPVGTVVGEILWVADENGKKWVYEIRTREKMPLSTLWEPAIFRPVKNRDELHAYLRLPADRPVVKKWFALRNTHEDEVGDFEGLVERIPNLTPAQTRQLLSRTFVEVTYEPWGSTSSAPASDQLFSIFPKDYTLGLISPDSESCAECHRQTQTSLWNLIPKEPLIYENPTKVSNIRGSDGIFSWYPFDPESIGDGKATPKRTQFRHYDWENIVQLHDRKMHRIDPNIHRLTKYVQDSLLPYELPQEKTVLHPVE